MAPRGDETGLTAPAVDDPALTAPAVDDPALTAPAVGDPALTAPAVEAPAETTPHPRAMVNAMTVDVEDYFHVSAFSSVIDREQWDSMPRRVESNVDRVLQVFDDFGVKATFFTLAWVAERHPALIRRIAEAGHEVASHGCDHVRVDHQTRDAFVADAARSKGILEDLSGQPVQGFRAPSFSMGNQTPWAFQVLAEAGYRYSSSIYPIRHDHYGMPDAPRFPFKPTPDGAILEIPITTTIIGGRRIPCGGGGYFRLLPYGLSKRKLRTVTETERRPAIFYFHPWELDPGQPRVADAPRSKRFRHYVNLGRMEGKLRSLLGDFQWDRVDRAFALS